MRTLGKSGKGPKDQGIRNSKKKGEDTENIYMEIHTYIRHKKRDESYKKETMNTWLGKGKEMWTTFTVGGVVKAL